MAEAYYSLAGPILKVSAESDDLLAPIDRHLGRLRAEAGAAERFRLSVRRGAPAELPGGARIYYRGELDGQGYCIFGEDETARYFLIPDRLSFTLPASGGEGLFTVRTGEERRLGGTPFFHAIDAALVAGGQTLIHAAAATLPDRKAAVLIFGPSGAGKTTVALALLRGGYGLFSDDVAVIRGNGGQFRLWGIPRALKVHRQTAALFPWLNGCLAGTWDSFGEQPLPMENAGELGRIEAAEPRKVAAVIRLNPRGAGEHALRPLAKNEALVSLSADNLRTATGGMPHYMQSRFGALAKLIQETPTFELTTGDDMEGLGGFIRSRIGA
ncbi:MAG TPA: hypothetical protein VK844_01505 [Hyphomicrobiales bacterium]|nr:hypothetical protein [Hyphomicrobiales bacterium]